MTPKGLFELLVEAPEAHGRCNPLGWTNQQIKA
jgi:hypothetical protein